MEKETREHMNVGEAAEIIGISKMSLWRLIRQRRFPHSCFNACGGKRRGRVIITRENIETFMKANAVPMKGED